MKDHMHQHSVDNEGVQRWTLNGTLDRTDGPSIVYPDGTTIWCAGGLLHRDDGPALTLADGAQYQYRHGQPARQSDVAA